jgi:predicted CXXCH cytochrome family protein
MKSLWKLPSVSSVSRWVFDKQSGLIWIAGGGASLALVLISCATTGRALMAPPSIPGATFIGSEACAECHEEINRDFKTADHAKLQAKGDNATDMGCESCHGPGSKHQESGGALKTIINPGNSPEACMQCHLDVKAQFSLPFSHQVMSGKMSCNDCHDPHKGSALKGGGTQITSANETCVKCHTQQSGPFVFPHDAVREGCTSCHSPHGSVNQKMLTERNSNLCLKCHFQQQLGLAGSDSISIGGSAHSGSRFNKGTCWTAGCHEAVHGSNVSNHLRN